ncbi:MAG: tetratricopeptide repeat protein [Myxococcota bacterium]
MDEPGSLETETRSIHRPDPPHAQPRWSSELLTGDATSAVLESETAPIAMGSNIGRYVALDSLGEGAMGRVLRAYDPRLGREVAIKQIKAMALDAATEARLAQEARAMARLSHPNVVGVYDVEVDRHRVLIVMEYVAGETLREWFRERRPWREVLEICVQAGRGLAAAHAAGLVHRDFKPGNVLLGADRRARVTDFGLAQVQGEIREEHSSLQSEEQTIRRTELDTSSGVVVGTPAYMAPEQHQGHATNDRADQYAFCVTLWEGLFGERPFRGFLFAQKKKGPPEPPRGHRIPRGVVEALRSGLAPDPAARHSSMGVLLDALERSVGARRRVWLTTMGAATVATLGLWALLPGSPQCSGAAAQLDSIWGPSQRESVQSALLETDVGYAADAWALVEAELDEYEGRWVELHTDTCEATAIRGEQSTEVLDLRMACLHDARDQLRAAVSVLEDADATVVERTRDVVAGLPRLSRCADVEALTDARRAPVDPQHLEDVEQLQATLAELAWQSRAGRYDEALGGLEPVRERADAIAHAPLQAEVLLLRGTLLDRLARPADAEEALREAMSLAIRSGSHRVATDAIVRLLEIVGSSQSRPAEALLLADMGMDLAERWGLGDDLVAALHRGRGIVLLVDGKPDEAEAAHRQALERLLRSHGDEHLQVLGARLSLAEVLAEQSKSKEAEAIYRDVLRQYIAKLGPEHPEVAAVHSRLGQTLGRAGRYADAEAEHRRAIVLLEGALGLEHPAVAEASNDLGTALFDQGRFDDAEQAYLRAKRIHEQATPDGWAPEVIDVINNLAQLAYRRGNLEQAESHARRALAVSVGLHGPDHSDVGRQRNNIAIVLKATGRLDEAAAELERVLEIYRGAVGPKHPWVASAHLNLGNVRVRQKRFDEALSSYERALSVYETAYGAEHPKVAFALHNVGSLHVQREDFAAAEPYCLRSLSLNEKILGDDHPDLDMSLTCLGRVALETGRHAEAIGHYERAVAVIGNNKTPRSPEPKLQLELARALWGDGQRRRARQLATSSLDGASRGERYEDVRIAAEAWLAEHPS